MKKEVIQGQQGEWENWQDGPRALCLEAAIVLWGHPLHVLGFLPSPGGKKVWAEAEMADHPQAPSQTAFTAASENGWPPPDALSSLPPPTSASPARRDMLAGGEGGVPAFLERSLRQ